MSTDDCLEQRAVELVSVEAAAVEEDDGDVVRLLKWWDNDWREKFSNGKS